MGQSPHTCAVVTMYFRTLCILPILLVTAQSKNTQENLTFVTVLSEPYLLIKDTDDDQEYEGFSVDLAAELGRELGKNLNLKVVDTYGKYDESTGQWSGMIGELIGGTADMAIADLTITDNRMEVIDFSTPFMKGGITLLHKKPEQFDGSIFSFLDPFNTEVWIVIIASYIVLALLFLFPRSRYKVEPEPKNNNTASASVFLLKFITVLYTLFLLSIYVANLSRFLNPETNQYPITTAEDLASQVHIKFGAVKSGSTEAFFKQSQESVYEKMWAQMSLNNDVFTKSNKEGIEKVKEQNGKYVFLMESTSAEYVLNRQCDLRTTGGLLNIISYGIGLPLKSSLRKQINEALLKLEADGVMNKLKLKWWEQKRGGGACVHNLGHATSFPQTLGSIGGLFVLLVVGLFLIVVGMVVGSVVG